MWEIVFIMFAILDFEKWKLFLFRINFVGKIIPSPNLLN